jgi:hypothetical protein
MEKSDSNNYPAANVIYEHDESQKSEFLKEYPIIRCQKCHEILSISFDLNSKLIILNCKKDKNEEKVEFQKFFDNINIYNEINCCQFCDEKRFSEKYYICKTCSNKILCEKCFKKHDKDDEIMPFKIDSWCKKHLNQLESYCPICQESKCSYCMMEHDSNHDKNEIVLRHKIFKKNVLDNFDKELKKISDFKNQIEENITSVINEMKSKIELIEKLKKEFFESLDMQMKFTYLVYNNYLKKLKDFDLNYYVINNLEKQINFSLSELVINENDSYENKITQIFDYLNNNIKKEFKINNNNININKNTKDIIDVDYRAEKVFDIKNVKGLVDLNQNLLILYTENSINIFDKKDYNLLFTINEEDFSGIKICKKTDDDKILMLTEKHLII